MAGTLVLFGAFIGIVTRMTRLILNSYQTFSEDKVLIKKLYSWKDNIGKRLQPSPDDFDEYLDDN